MKAITLFIISFITACNHPIHVTTKVDDRAATSGTLGSARVENGVRTPIDTARRKTDTLKIVRDSL